MRRRGITRRDRRPAPGRLPVGPFSTVVVHAEQVFATDDEDPEPAA